MSVVGLRCFHLWNCCSCDLCCVSAVELSPTHAEQQKREQILAGLERFIRKEYNGEQHSKPNHPGPSVSNDHFHEPPL